ncbi:MAG: peptidase C45, partial [Deltaproteobacteria bacterium]|nr:peptidase C45 [Deltaproteobacteria bacterium]
METSKLKIIDLEGDPRNRGRIHGEELRLDIQDVIENYTRAMEI